MAIKYCDFTNGVDYNALTAWLTATVYVVDDVRKNGTAAYKCIQNHTSGDLDDEPGVGAVWTTYWSLESDGSNTDPYKTITDASIGLTGGDEVRVAKSVANTALTGTLGFTIGSTAVVGTGTLFSSELAIGDFVQGGDGQWYEVVTITDNTNAVLFKVYPSTTGAGVTGYKLGITSTGAAAASSTAIQTVSASGVSTASRLKISGGWDLTGPTQDGQTYFRQMHGTFANRYGYGLSLGDKDYIEIERCHFLRYNKGVYILLGSYITISSPNCSSNVYGIHIAGNVTGNPHNITITSPICNSNNSYGIALVGFSVRSIHRCEITSPICNSNNYGIYASTASDTIISSPVCNSNVYGIYLIYFPPTIVSPTFNNNSTAAFLFMYVLDCVANNFSNEGNAAIFVIVSNRSYQSEKPILKCNHFNAAGDNRCYYEYGVTYRDTANARSTQCLKYDPTSATYYISQSFFFKADSGVAQTLSAYIKDDASFNGDIQAAVYFMGEKITGWTEWTPTTSYVQKTIVAASGDITEDGILELRIKVRGTAGNVFVDDLATA